MKALLYILMFLVSIPNAIASVFLEEDLEAIYGSEEMVSIATGTQRPVVVAPAVTSVISSDEIRLLGAQTIDEVLETIPGLHVARTHFSANPTYVVRGMYSVFNQQILILVNGVPTTNLYFNNRGMTWGGLPVHSIDRIEVIRGPGSAVHGADAFTGVINIVTKNYDTAENKAGLLVGSHDSGEIWLTHKNIFGRQLKSTLSLDLLTTDDSSGTVYADSATYFDGLFSTDTSLAPGELNRGRDLVEALWMLEGNQWLFNLNYHGHYQTGTGAGHAEALDPVGLQNTHRFSGHLKHTLTNAFIKDFDLTNEVSFLHVDEDIQLQLYPEGYLGIYSEGLIGEPAYKEKHLRWNTSFTYRGFKNHDIRSGIGYYSGELYDIKENKNFDSSGLPLGSVVNVTNDPSLIYIYENTREQHFLFLQDEWRFLSDWTLTTGIRFDHYSDYGDVFTQRLSLVWLVNHEFTAKWLYGSAYRAPSFADLYVTNNPVTSGNPNLEAEENDTLEFSLIYHSLSGLEASVNVYHYWVDNLIENISDGPGLVTQNVGELEGYGIEFESSWRLNNQIKFYGNASVHRTEDEVTNTDAGLYPRSLLYFNSQIKLNLHWSLVPQVNWIGTRNRDNGDSRDPIDDVAYTHLNIIYEPNSYRKKWSSGLTIKNVFDENIRYPSTSEDNIPDDIPGERQSVSLFFEMEY